MLFSAGGVHPNLGRHSAPRQHPARSDHPATDCPLKGKHLDICVQIFADANAAAAITINRIRADSPKCRSFRWCVYLHTAHDRCPAVASEGKENSVSD
jgi:hypothetical protein